jgi:hypothetical protein
MGVTDPKIKVDHRNHRTLDCRRRTNLRICTNAQNSANRKGPDTRSTSGIRGVCWNRHRKKWVAQIGVDGKIIYLGAFADKAAAATAYAAANRQHFGSFGGRL